MRSTLPVQVLAEVSAILMERELETLLMQMLTSEFTKEQEKIIRSTQVIPQEFQTLPATTAAHKAVVLHQR